MNFNCSVIPNFHKEREKKPDHPLPKETLLSLKI